MDRTLSQQPSSATHDLVSEALRHHQAGQFAEAEQIYRQVLAVEPDHPDALHLLGMVAYQTGRDEAAVELIRRAIAIKSDAASYHSNLGNVLQSQGKLAEAGACYQRALVLKPDLAEVHLNLGNIFKAHGDVDSGLACYRRALALNPQSAEAAVAESMALLLKGDFAAGWRNFEQRWQTKDYDTKTRTYTQPLWTGDPLTSGRVLIWGEQGIGDEIMFAGLVPDVLRTGNRCALDCDARLQPLFSRSFPGVEVVSTVEPGTHPELDMVAHLPSGSLPGLFRASPASFAETTSPYLLADPAERDRFRARYFDGRKLVGLAWHTKNKKTGRSRSIDLSLLAPLLVRPGIRWISLQYGDHDWLREQATATNAPLLIDPDVDQLSNIDRFAAQIAAMDLVITIDNSAAHLAGALGVPTWVLLPFSPDWRWLLSREDSPWYPTTRLFRQTSLGDWGSVVRDVENALGQNAPS
ncbi:MAG: tetratricopeptide repeat protein [Terracidiphilus sp.]